MYHSCLLLRYTAVAIRWRLALYLVVIVLLANYKTKAQTPNSLPTTNKKAATPTQLAKPTVATRPSKQAEMPKTVANKQAAVTKPTNTKPVADKVAATDPKTPRSTTPAVLRKTLAASQPAITVLTAKSKPKAENSALTTAKHTAKFENRDTSLLRIKNLSGNLSPKSVVHCGDGRFFAQNMMYNHTISVYNRDFSLLKTIKDQVKLSDYGIENASGMYKGAPVEAAFSHNGQYAWVSNYRMYGEGFTQNLSDDCPMSDQYEGSYLYRINTDNYAIEQVIAVGSVPKYVAVTPDNRYVLVSNWCSGDLSIVDIANNTEIKRVAIGAHPRGIVVDAASEYAYIAVMGGSSIAVLDLRHFTVSRINKVGITPRHLCLSPDERYLYATFNNESNVGKIDLQTRTLTTKVRSGKAPRSMVLSGDGKYLYVVNYNDANISKIQTSDMTVLQKIKTPLHPIGITIDNLTDNVWVACYSGSIAVYHDRRIGQPPSTPPDNPAMATPKTPVNIQQTTGTLPTKKPLQTSSNAPNKPVIAAPAKEQTTTAVPQKTPALQNSESLGFFSSIKHTFWSIFAAPEPPASAPKSYCIIIASFTDQNKHKIPDYMQKAAIIGFLPELLSEKKLGRYRLVCGKYKQRNDAEKALNEVRCYYPDAWIL